MPLVRVCAPPPEGMYTSPTGTTRIVAGQSVAEKNLPSENCAYPQGDCTYPPEAGPRPRKPCPANRTPNTPPPCAETTCAPLG